MADLNITPGAGHKAAPGVRKSKKLSTRIDLTPMVDLGFLLITFFIFTTTLAKPNTMEINMPYKDFTVPTKPNEIKEKTALTVLLSSHHKVYYYEGIGDDVNNPPQLKLAYFTQQQGIRDVITGKKKMVADLKRSGILKPEDETTVLIKPDSTSTYNDLVNMLDEMNINDVGVYAIVDISNEERDLIKASEMTDRIKE